MKFFYTHVLGRKSIKLSIPPRKQKKQLPEIFGVEELERLFMAPCNPKNRAVLMTTYSAGLRVSEVVSSKVSDPDSERMMIRVEQGKGNKDRYTVFSQRLLTELRLYWKMYRPKLWLFPAARNQSQPMHIGTAQKIYYQESP